MRARESNPARARTVAAEQARDQLDRFDPQADGDVEGFRGDAGYTDDGDVMARNGERGPDKKPRKGSPRRGRPGASPRDESPSRVRRAKLVELIVSGLTPNRAAAVIGINPANAYRWMQRPEIAAEIDRRLSEGVAAAQARLRASVDAAIDTIVELNGAAPDEVVNDGDRTYTRKGRHDPVRKAAAEAILNRIGMASAQEVKVSGGLVVMPDLSHLTPEQLVKIARPEGDS